MARVGVDAANDRSAHPFAALVLHDPPPIERLVSTGTVTVIAYDASKLGSIADATYIPGSRAPEEGREEAVDVGLGGGLDPELAGCGLRS